MRAQSILLLAGAILLLPIGIGIGRVFADVAEFEVFPDQYATPQSSRLVADGIGGNPAGVGENDVCVDGWYPLTQPDEGELYLNPEDGTFTFEAPPNFIGTATFSYGGVLRNAELVAASAVWNYFNPDGADPTIADPDFNESWHTPGFDDSAWSQGSGAMGRGGFGGQSQPDTIFAPTRVATYYFRHRFEVPAGSYALALNLIRDDGAIIYLDGQEVARSHPADATAFATAPDTYDLLVGRNADETTIFREDLGTHALAAGGHVLAISVHNSNLTGSDHGVSFRSLQAGDLESGPAAVSISVTDAGLPPILTDDYFAIPTDRILQASVLDNDRLHDGSGTAYDPILEVLVTAPPDGEFNFEPLTGEFSFDPAPGFTGVTEASYRVRDKDGLSAVASISIAVTPPDTGVILLADDGFTLAQGETFQTGSGVGRTVQLNDLHVRRVLLSEPASFGTVELTEDGKVSYTPHPNFIGTDSFTYSALLAKGDGDWKFLHPLDAVDPATADPDFNSTWATAAFDDAGWSDGAGLMGYGTIGELTLDTDIGTPPVIADELVRKTAYFRTTFDSPVAETLDLKMRLIRDDAAIIYLNGVEIGRSHPTTTGLFADEPDVYDLMFPANSGSPTPREAIPASESFAGVPLASGANLLAISVHNHFFARSIDPNSSDLALQLLSISTGATAAVSLIVEDSGNVPEILPDQVFSTQADPIAGNLYANDGLLDPEGNAYDPILDIEASGALSPFITSLDRETGEFQIEPPADLIGSAEFFYRVADKDGWSELAAVSVHIQPDAVANPFVRIAPLGSSVAASLGTPLEIAAADAIEVTLPDLTQGPLSITLRSPAPLLATMTLFGPDGLELTSATAAPGGTTLLEFEAVLPQHGRYKLVIENQSPDPLGASLDLYSNARVSREQGAGMASAIELDPMFSALAGGDAQAANLIVETDLSTFSGAVVFEENFESGALAPEWDFEAYQSGTGAVSSARGAADGSVFALVLQGFTLKWVERSIDLSGVANPILRFAQASWDRGISANGDGGNRGDIEDGVRVSVDGEEWFSVFSPPEHGESGDWFTYEVDLKRAAARGGFSTDGIVYLQFGHDGDNEEDARGFDQVKIIERPSDERWQRISLTDGETLSAHIANLEPWTGDVLVEILDPLSNILASAPPGTETGLEFTDTSVDGVPAEYFLRVTTARSAYSLALIKGAQVSAPGLGETPRTHRGISRGFLSRPGEDFVAVAFENVSSDGDRVEIADKVRSLGADCVLALGKHLIYTNRRELDDWETYLGVEFGEFMLGRIDGRFPAQTSPTQRLFPIAGDGDVVASGSVPGGSLGNYLEYFHENPGGEKRLPQDGGAVHSAGESYYQFRCGPAHFFCLDSHHALTNPQSHQRQRLWLQSGLAESDARWKFVVSHSLPYSNIKHLISPEMRWEGEWLGASAVIGGSSELFEHIQSGGIDYFATSNGSRSYGFGPLAPGTKALYDTTIYNEATEEFGLFTLTANDSGVRVELVKTGGGRLYQTEIGTPGLDRPSEVFEVELVAGNAIALATSIPAAVGRLPNTLELSVQVRDPGGSVVAHGDGAGATAIVTPTQTGTYQVEVSTSSGAGEFLLTGRTPTAWQLWQVENFGPLPATGTSGALDDPDRDRRANVIEYAFGSDPNVPATGQTAVMASDSDTGTGRAVLLRLPQPPRDDIALELQISSDLGASDWTTIATRLGADDWAGMQPTTVEEVGGTALLEFELPGETRIFARFSVSRIAL